MKLLQEGKIKDRGWVVVDHRGVAMLKSASLTRRMAIAYVTYSAQGWREFSRLGWRCQRFSLIAA